MIITKIFEKAINTRNGLKVKRTIVSEKGMKLQVWPESWNPQWREGATVEINNEWITQSEYNGEIQYTYNVPKDKQIEQPVITIEKLYEEVQKLSKSVDTLIGMQTVKKIEEELKPQHQEIRLEDINF